MSEPIPPEVLRELEAMPSEIVREIAGMCHAVRTTTGPAAGTVRVFKDRAGSMRHTTTLEMSAARYVEVGSERGST